MKTKHQRLLLSIVIMVNMVGVVIVAIRAEIRVSQCYTCFYIRLRGTKALRWQSRLEIRVIKIQKKHYWAHDEPSVGWTSSFSSNRSNECSLAQLSSFPQLTHSCSISKFGSGARLSVTQEKVSRDTSPLHMTFWRRLSIQWSKFGQYICWVQRK